VKAESVSPRVQFDAELTKRIASTRGWPVIATGAGHDAGVLSAAGLPTAMLFVRNPTGVSHAPSEFAEMSDCLAGVEALADAVAELTT
jgi:N-carbamoyl-L-amino-acid hydrolase